MVVSTASRFQVVESLVRNPGQTLITSAIQGPFIDTGLDLGLGDRPAWRGRVYLSKDEVREMAEQLGLFDESREIFVAQVNEQAVNDATSRGFDVGYAAGRAENLDHLADELVARMRDRVRRPAADVAVAASAGGDDPAAAAAPAPVADAPVGEDADGVLGADGDGRSAPRGSGA